MITRVFCNQEYSARLRVRDVRDGRAICHIEVMHLGEVVARFDRVVPLKTKSGSPYTDEVCKCLADDPRITNSVIDHLSYRLRIAEGERLWNGILNLNNDET